MFLLSIGGAIYGYSIGVVSGIIPIMQNTISSTTSKWSLFVASFLYGVGFIILIAGYLVNILGCRKLFISGAWISFVAVMTFFFTNNIYILILSRFILGVACGLMNVSIPIYIAESLPPASRGRGTASFQLSLSFGIFISSIICLFLAKYNSWHLIFLFQLFICLVTVFITHITLESPMFLITHGKYEESMMILKKTRSLKDAQKDFNDLSKLMLFHENQKKISLHTQKSRVLLLPVFLAMLMCLLNQSTCINAILQYREQILNQVIDNNISLSASASFIAFINFISTFFAIIIIDKIERKNLLQIGLCGLLICSITLFIIFKFHVLQNLLLLILSLFIIFYAIGPGALVWTIVSEIIPYKIKGIGIALALSTGSLTAAVITMIYLPVIHKVGVQRMFLFSSITIAVFILISRYLPNTTKKSLAEIELSYNS